MFTKTLLITAALFVAGCSSIPPQVASRERSDRVQMHAYTTKERRVVIDKWTPGGPQDTDGKPGEPSCPDCDGNGPVYIGSVRPD